ncbi:ATPase [Caldimicrobium thiodismutans]|uniref:histidine kinase n=1 Tax=Caldimicrobium thiodismutans TaxID=1653476 RepID=A0A0U5AG35_9BACT|nr:chemotaxis protein CheW [Caldimicrobium thiodismutans]BAU22951.1 ATPase [Caldimicrobium thiodismutans]
MIDEDILKDFLVEAKDGIAKMEEEFIELEKDKGNLEIIKSLFRTMHSLKGASGFFGFKSLEGIAHFAEDILGKIRDGEIEPTEEVIDILLKCLDEIKYIVAYLEENKTEPVEDRILDFLVDLSNFTNKLKKKGEVQLSKEAEKGVTSEVKPEEVSHKEEPFEEKAKTKEEPEVEEKVLNENVLPEEKREAEKEEKTVATPQIQLTETHIKVDVKLLDQLMNLAGELVLARNRVVQLANKINEPELSRSVQSLSMVTTELQETIMKTRMQPIGVVFNKFPRIVRDLAKALNKKVNLHLEGTETELDRSIIEAIKDPLTHLVRNSIDHGIEAPEVRVQAGKPPEGNLILRAYHEGGQVIIEIEDDGKGIDLEKIKKKAIEKGFVTPEEAEKLSDKEILSFIFKSGFSTAEKVTQVSGRGVGMDVVKTNIEKLGGSIELNTFLGKGTTVRIKIPLTLAIIPALIVTSHDQRYAIPQVSLRELVSINPETDILKMGDTEFYRLRGEIIPVVRLSRALGFKNGKSEKSLVILNTGERHIGLLVDQIYDSEEIVVKPLGKWFKNIPLYSGATIMGDGKLALILDVVGLSQLAGLKTEEIERSYEEKKFKTSAEETQFILIFNVGEDSLALPLALISRLDKIKAEEIQIIGGKEVILYKNKVIPLIRLENYLPIQGSPPQEEYNILFFTEREKTCAILCSKIVDTLETTLEVEVDLYVQPGILGHRIINNKTILFLDIYKVIEMYDPEWFIVKREEPEENLNILLAEDSPFFQNMIRNYLVQAGFEVEVAGNGEEALKKLKAGYKPALIISDIEMPVMDGFEFIKNVRSIPEYKDIPIMVLTSLTGEDIKKKVFELGANAYEVKLEREKVLRAIEELLSYKKEMRISI